MVTLDGTCISVDDFRMTPHTLARHLGRVVRFGGSVDVYWSVLQHSLFVESLAEQAGFDARVRLLALVHDAHEFITGDWPRPWKAPCVSMVQTQIDDLLHAALGLPRFGHDEHAKVKALDDMACAIEANVVATVVLDAMPDKFKAPDWQKHVPALVRLGADPFKNCWEADGKYVVWFTNRFHALKEQC